MGSPISLPGAVKSSGASGMITSKIPFIDGLSARVADSLSQGSEDRVYSMARSMVIPTAQLLHNRTKKRLRHVP